MSFILRPEYQAGQYEETRNLMLQGVKRILVQGPTGSGKTALAANMFDASAKKGMDSWFIVHRKELIAQSSKAFNKQGIPHAFIANGWTQDLRYKVQICSVDTLISRLPKLRKVGLRLPRFAGWDEAHHLAATTWTQLQKDLGEDTFHLGFTATPWRLNGEGLDPFFDMLVRGPQTLELIRMGYLSPYILFKPPGAQIDSSTFKTDKSGDWTRSSVSKVVDKPKVYGDALKEYLRVGRRRGIIFAPSIEVSLHACEKFNSAGFIAKHVDAKTPAGERQQASDDFEAGKIDLLSNVGLFGEGYDVPAAEVLIDLSPTQSLSQALQRWGRVLRPIYKEGMPLTTNEERCAAIAAGPKPNAFIIDHAGNSIGRHGLPDDFRNWSLKGGVDNLHSANAGGPSNRLCSKCGAAYRQGQDNCPFCNTPYEIQSREVEEVEADLEIVDISGLRKQQLEQEMDMSLDELLREGVKRGYARPETYANAVFAQNQKMLKARGRHA